MINVFLAQNTSNASKEYRKPYICLLTSLAVDKDLRLQAKNSGIDEVIQKPIFKAGAKKLLTKA